MTKIRTKITEIESMINHVFIIKIKSWFFENIFFSKEERQSSRKTTQKEKRQIKISEKCK